MQIDHTISNIYHKTSILIAKLKSLKEERDNLQKEIELKKLKMAELNEYINSKNIEIAKLSNDIDALKLSQGIKAEKVSTDNKVKEKINELIKEVDKCINLLSN